MVSWKAFLPLPLLLSAVPAWAASHGATIDATTRPADGVVSESPDNSSRAVSITSSAGQAAMVQLASYEVPTSTVPAASVLSGLASWYGRSWKGRHTANGGRFNPNAMTAASSLLPLGTRVLVTLEGTAHSVLVTITDRQGDARRVIDLSLAAARRIGMVGMGTAQVTLQPVG